MKIVIGCDHAAFEAKERLVNFLKDKYQHTIEDVGTYSNDRCDYPVFAVEAVKKVVKEDIMGILLCGSGIGVSIVANRYKGIRAALCRTPDDAEMSRKHNDSNVLCIGARVSSTEEIEKIVDSWLNNQFEGGRHSERIELFNTRIGEEI